jgi:hypothetical protein
MSFTLAASDFDTVDKPTVEFDSLALMRLDSTMQIPG